MHFFWQFLGQIPHSAAPALEQRSGCTIAEEGGICCPNRDLPSCLSRFFPFSPASPAGSPAQVGCGPGLRQGGFGDAGDAGDAGGCWGWDGEITAAPGAGGARCPCLAGVGSPSLLRLWLFIIPPLPFPPSPSRFSLTQWEQPGSLALPSRPPSSLPPSLSLIPPFSLKTWAPGCSPLRWQHPCLPEQPFPLLLQPSPSLSRVPARRCWMCPRGAEPAPGLR